MKHIIDAEGKPLGRVATQAAVFLMGKDMPSFERNTAPSVTVTVTNASKARIGAKKMDKKTHKRYSGYPGGLKKTTIGDIVKKKGYGEVFRNAIHGMLPSNKLRPKMMKNLVIME